MSKMFENINKLFESDDFTISEEVIEKPLPKNSVVGTDPIDFLEQTYDDFVRSILPYIKKVMKEVNVIGDHDLDGDVDFWNDLYEYIALHTNASVETSIKEFITGEGSKYFKTVDVEVSNNLFEELSDEDRKVALINSTLEDESAAVDKWQQLIDSGLFTDDEVEHMKKDQQEEREHIETLKSML